MESPSRPPRSPEPQPIHFRAPGTAIYSASGECRKTPPLAPTGRAICPPVKAMGVEAEHPRSHSVARQAKQEEVIEAPEIYKQIGRLRESYTSPYKIGNFIFKAGGECLCIFGRMGGRTEVTVPNKYVRAVPDIISRRYVGSAPLCYNLQ